jgi:6-phosphogluconate dehydrogenase
VATGLGKFGRHKPDATAEPGCLHCGPYGIGHFVKMVHNGIEYDLMVAYAQGPGILRNVKTVWRS